jgi:hypothetical protein
MMKLKLAMILMLVSLLLPTYMDAAAEPLSAMDQQNVSKDVREANQTLIKWLKGFKNKTADDVRKALGDPTDENVWSSGEKNELLLNYELGNSTSLSLYFYKNRVVKASLHLLL